MPESGHKMPLDLGVEMAPAKYGVGFFARIALVNHGSYAVVVTLHDR